MTDPNRWQLFLIRYSSFNMSTEENKLLNLVFQKNPAQEAAVSF